MCSAMKIGHSIFVSVEQNSENNKPICVVLDTNIWRRNPLLKNPLGAALLFSLRRTGACIGLPEVIEDEIVKNIVKMG